MDPEKADAREKERYVFLYELAKHTSDPVQIRSELLNVLLAGRDTTASLLSNIFFVLARRPDLWEKARDEVDALGGEKPTTEQMRAATYLEYIMKEGKSVRPAVEWC